MALSHELAQFVLHTLFPCSFVKVLSLNCLVDLAKTAYKNQDRFTVTSDGPFWAQKRAKSSVFEPSHLTNALFVDENQGTLDVPWFSKKKSSSTCPTLFIRFLQRLRLLFNNRPYAKS